MTPCKDAAILLPSKDYETNFDRCAADKSSCCTVVLVWNHRALLSQPLGNGFIHPGASCALVWVELLPPCPCLFFLPSLVGSLLIRATQARWVLKPSGPWSYSLAFSLTLDPPSSLTKCTGHSDVGLCVLLVKSSYRQEPRLSVCGLYSKTYLHFTGTDWYCTGARCPPSHAFLIF